jgi:branched-chain amino acid transport system ATP-binding protein
MADALLEVTGLRAGYGGVEVLRGIDLTVAPGEIVAVLGSNGVGKTTLNKALSGVVAVRGGGIGFNGARIDRSPSTRIVEAGLIHVPEGRRVFADMSVRDNLVLGSYRRGRPRRSANFDLVLDTFPRLRERLAQAAGTLSGGEQQMLAIGRGMMAEPLLLILDEPSLGLSPLLVEEMFALIARLRQQGLAIMLVEQNVVQSLDLADRAYVLENGRFVLSGPASELRADPDLKRTYLGL